MRWLAAFLFLLASSLPALALDPSEKLADPVLEARARALDFEIRCVKCQSEAVASSNAAWAQDARRIIRELIADGASNDEVLDWFYARYGDFVLMEPKRGGLNTLLWYAGPLLLLGGLGVGWVAIRRRRAVHAAEGLTAEEEARLKALLDE